MNLPVGLQLSPEKILISNLQIAPMIIPIDSVFVKRSYFDRNSISKKRFNIWATLESAVNWLNVKQQFENYNNTIQDSIIIITGRRGNHLQQLAACSSCYGRATAVINLVYIHKPIPLN